MKKYNYFYVPPYAKNKLNVEILLTSYCSLLCKKAHKNENTKY